MTGSVALRFASGSGSSSPSLRGASGSPARCKAHPEPPHPDTSLLPWDQGSPFPTTGARTAQSAFKISSASPPPTGAVLPAPERWGRYKGVEVTEKEQKRDGTLAEKLGLGAFSPRVIPPSLSLARFCPGIQNLHPPSRLAGWWPRSSRAASAPNANSCSPRRRRPQLCQLVCTHFDQRSNPDL